MLQFTRTTDYYVYAENGDLVLNNSEVVQERGQFLPSTEVVCDNLGNPRSISYYTLN